MKTFEEFMGEGMLSSKPPRKGSLAWEMQQQRKEYDKKNPPVEPGHNQVGNARVIPKGPN